MPSVSQAQNRAMHAAAEGNSTLGIPKKVGKEFTMADEGRKIGKLPEKKGDGEKEREARGKRKKDKRSLGERLYGKAAADEKGPAAGGRWDNG